MTHHFNLQIPAGIEKAMLRVGCAWLGGGFHAVAPELKTSKSVTTSVNGLVERVS